MELFDMTFYLLLSWSEEKNIFLCSNEFTHFCHITSWGIIVCFDSESTSRNLNKRNVSTYSFKIFPENLRIKCCGHNNYTHSICPFSSNHSSNFSMSREIMHLIEK